VFSIAIGQDIGILLLVLVVTLRALDAQKPLLAGLILSLCLIKFHLFLLLPLLFLGKREWRLAAGFSIGAVFLLMVSFAGVRNWPRSYLALILDPAVSPDSGLMPNVHGMAAYLPGSGSVEFVLTLGVIVLVWRVVSRARFEVGLVATLLGGLLLTRHVYLQDCAILTGSLVTLLRRPANRVAGALGLVLLLPFPYVFILLLRGSVTAALFMFLVVALAWADPGRGPSKNGLSLVSEPRT
jgi:hypothetical protein